MENNNLNETKPLIKELLYIALLSYIVTMLISTMIELKEIKEDIKELKEIRIDK